MRTVHALRYITPLREGGSLPAVVETDDDGMAVLKFRGAGQGPKALIAELIAGEMARALSLPMLLRVMNYPEQGLDQLPATAAAGTRNGAIVDDA